MKKVIVQASSSKISPRQEVEAALVMLKEAFDAFESMSDAAFEYVPDHIVDDLDVAVHEIHYSLYGN